MDHGNDNSRYRLLQRSCAFQPVQHVWKAHEEVERLPLEAGLAGECLDTVWSDRDQVHMIGDQAAFAAAPPEEAHRASTARPLSTP